VRRCYLEKFFRLLRFHDFMVECTDCSGAMAVATGLMATSEKVLIGIIELVGL
jgi:hypothetical protein